ncbi:hypothetical protein CFIMG_006398RA [Ceratocystis fimbriata CBS 114723]|uniref:Uncharacterized protein n=1 Tax=Ceratocystis fimbriata CBS 114723 TaxID=1035309 RepID=A0A2C5W8N9_9PEZI|nr:hypothetical protein CFIMG_006398RA [Ceratocystis fimbriata CBS 114723]
MLPVDYGLRRYYHFQEIEACAKATLNALVSWIFTTAKFIVPSSFLAALTSSHGISMVVCIHAGSVGPSYAPQRRFTATVLPRMYLLKSRRGHQLGCLSKPVGVVINGEMTLTLCAIFAMPMWRACRIKTFSQTATASASESVYASSPPCSPGARTGSQTFHSSKQIVARGTVGGTLFSIRARSISAAVIWMARSADSGAVTLGKCWAEAV